MLIAVPLHVFLTFFLARLVIWLAMAAAITDNTCLQSFTFNVKLTGVDNETGMGLAAAIESVR